MMNHETSAMQLMISSDRLLHFDTPQYVQNSNKLHGDLHFEGVPFDPHDFNVNLHATCCNLAHIDEHQSVAIHQS